VIRQPRTPQHTNEQTILRLQPSSGPLPALSPTMQFAHFTALLQPAGSRPYLPLSTLPPHCHYPVPPHHTDFISRPRHGLHTRGCRASASDPRFRYYIDWTRKLRICTMQYALITRTNPTATVMIKPAGDGSNALVDTMCSTYTIGLGIQWTLSVRYTNDLPTV